MSPLRNPETAEAFADSDAITTVAYAAAIVIDDSWLEAVLDNLALAQLSRHRCIELLKRLEDFERELVRSHPRHRGGSIASFHQIVVGEHFDAQFNAHDMRSPDAMTPANVLETIESAARNFATEGHLAALKQLVFFISSNIEEALADEALDSE